MSFGVVGHECELGRSVYQDFTRANKEEAVGTNVVVMDSCSSESSQVQLRGQLNLGWSVKKSEMLRTETLRTQGKVKGAHNLQESSSLTLK